MKNTESKKRIRQKSNDMIDEFTFAKRVVSQDEFLARYGEHLMNEDEVVENKKRQARIMAIANQKGGVGKTTTAINLATALAACKKKILIIDNDSQGNASTGLGIEQSSRKLTSYDLYSHPEQAMEAVMETKIDGLSIIPASIDLAAADVEFVGQANRNQKLKQACKRLSDDFDYIFIDCPPALGVLTINALTAAQSLLIPLQCEFYALEGLGQLINTVNRVKSGLNPDLDIQGVVLTMYDKRNNLSQSVANDVRSHLGDKVYQTMIPRNVRISEAPSFGKPVLLYDLTSTGAAAYLHLASEVIQQEQNSHQFSLST